MATKKAFVIKDPSDPYYGCTFPMRFEEFGARRRAALRLLPNIEDPESKSRITISRFKSSRKYKIDNDRNRAYLDGGYRLCRCSRLMQKYIKYFWEFVWISSDNSDSHVRMGIATTKAEMEAPVGVDEEGYCVRDLGGAFHKGRKMADDQYSEGIKPFPGFKTGDAVGFGFTKQKDIESAKLEVWINGEYSGVVFDNIDPKKGWIPAFSCYRGATIEANFDDFLFEPGVEWKPIAQIPAENTKKMYTINQMIDVMKNGTQSLRTKEMFAATDAVLTPIHEMPI